MPSVCSQVSWTFLQSSSIESCGGRVTRGTDQGPFIWGKVGKLLYRVILEGRRGYPTHTISLVVYDFAHFALPITKSQMGSDLVRDDPGEYVVEHLADDDAVLVVDENGFLKKGNESAGVQR